mmetsp:Transcript_27866/g.67793  ORF Transcript_27866/g.67793 Transcript_27866/m.67793 type:complete len:255 (-) Transcript_27866:127-891(-)|eukprot:CAMPEP_0113643318 /NCGR_PEP_ID=MMETSP0017_2-20120614/22774_1 /TAXON_ID=2856 /ORGANISM="Cylindrotheca closterium" /LENGTH=254 /DNA_ID=CAMNT_0000554821 /DNA_START=46 /DNA_END=810 /DNA_ORIENTATION=- /assembly_acc=CAM_ASM_000147
MKIFSLAFQVVALAATSTSIASAFTAQTQPSSAATSTSLGMSSFHTNNDPDALSENRSNEMILSVLGMLEGPSVCYGHFAAVDHKRELDIKEYDNFDAFKAIIEQVDCDKILRGNGPFTVFAPTNSAIEKFDGVFDEEVVKTHIIPKDLYTDELDGTFETLSGHMVEAKRQFRKIYVDEAMVGQLDNHTGGTPYPTNVICENGVIHTINTVLKAGWTRPEADSQGVQGLSLQSHLNQDVLKDRGALPEDAKSSH